MKVLYFPGWGQSPDFPVLNSYKMQLSYYPYLSYRDFSDLCFFIQKNDQLSSEIVIGWSLGAQIVLRLFDAGLISTKYLILISTPFQMVASKSFRFGTSQDKFDQFFQSFKKSPKATLANFTLEATAKIHELSDQEYQKLSIENLANWLSELGNASLTSLNFDKIKSRNTKIALIHGKEDKIISKFQSNHLAKILGCKLHIVESCGHAPHLERPNEIEIILQNTISI